MTFRTILPFALGVLFLSACSSNSDTTTGDAGTAPSDAATQKSDATVAADPQWAAVHKELKASCTPCHSTNGLGGANFAQADSAKAYADSQLPSYFASCAGKTKGECNAVRIRKGDMPTGGALPVADQTRIGAAIDAWVAAGQKGP
jgi:uncharacterized membrane protein